MKGRRGRFRTDLIGRQFGKWTVIAEAESPSGQEKVAYWLCRCDCGTERPVRAGLLVRGASQSCGCAHLGRPGKAGRKHDGRSRDPEYRIWIAMRQRCANRKNPHYLKHYIKKGIKVCERWSGDSGYENFIADMGKRPSPEHSIDRIDNSGDYEPGNCRWATRKEQTLNRGCTRLIEFNGEALTVYDWARKTGIHKNTIEQRLIAGWTPEQALMVKAEANKKPKSLLHVNGRYLTTEQAAAEYGLRVNTLRCRLARGWPVDAALTTPLGGKRPPQFAPTEQTEVVSAAENVLEKT